MAHLVPGFSHRLSAQTSPDWEIAPCFTVPLPHRRRASVSGWSFRCSRILSSRGPWRTRGWRGRHDVGSQGLAGGLQGAPFGARRSVVVVLVAVVLNSKCISQFIIITVGICLVILYLHVLRLHDTWYTFPFRCKYVWCAGLNPFLARMLIAVHFMAKSPCCICTCISVS